MKYIIKGYKELKRNRWFINNDFGICIKYSWDINSAEVSIDSSFLEEGCEEELDRFIDPLMIDPENDKNLDRFEIDYPAPWFLTNPNESTTWRIPSIEKKLSSSFSISMSSNYVFSKATELENKKMQNFWSTNDDIFKWDSKNVRPSKNQNILEYELMAQVWLSNAWVSEKNLNEFMAKEFDMAIEDDTVILFSPSMYVNK